MEHAVSSPEDKVGAARADPLAEARATADATAANRAYESFQHSVSAAGPVGVIGGATISGGMHIYATGHPHRTPSSGPVRADHLEQIKSWYAAAPHDPELRSALNERHVVVIQGLRESGRTTTALKLLSEFATTGVEWLAVESGLNGVSAERLQPGHGYLGELPTLDHRLDEAALDGFSQRLRERGAYCVLLPPPGSEEIRAQVYLRGHVPPPQGAVLKARIEAEGARRRPGRTGDLDVMIELSRDKELWDLLGTDPGPAEEVWLAEMVIRLADGSCDRQYALSSWNELIDRRIGRWLAQLPQGVDLHRQRSAVEDFAFRLALAVFNDSPVHLVVEAGERLAFELFTTANPRLEPGRNVFASLDDDRMAMIWARMRDGTVGFGDVSVPARLLAYRDERVAVRLLATVWNQRPNLRRPILRWLRDLSQDRRPDIWMRAALAIGLVTSWDFAYSYHEAIESWAGSEDVKQRLAAATAMNQTARDENTRLAVSSALRSWAGGDEPGLMWTAAVAFGYGVSDAASVLRLLHRIGVWKDGELVHIASKSVAELFARGRFAEVLKAVDSWIDDRRLNGRILGLLVVLRVGDLRVSQVPNIEGLPLGPDARAALADSARANWPLVVAVAQFDAAIGRLLADCVWQALSSALVADAMRDEIGDWIRAADESADLLGPLGTFLRGLIDDEDDEARLLHLVDTLTEDPDEPLPQSTAQAVREAIGWAAVKRRGES
ncbi:hypothetical protein KDL01_29275 [Actinospica durhamensis]|uniref:LigA protein n=1 Tax=Actinospica durhamensis TaxID=1508375 RepID=A0A941ESS5_9ACTN|nr:hypothetical protein [Actinospica durhamensis]MBR7837407.1 hypothetical protein [Actinospica durhamensis]